MEDAAHPRRNRVLPIGIRLIVPAAALLLAPAAMAQQGPAPDNTAMVARFAAACAIPNSRPPGMACPLPEPGLCMGEACVGHVLPAPAQMT